jgi:hypothetical protein
VSGQRRACRPRWGERKRAWIRSIGSNSACWRVPPGSAPWGDRMQGRSMDVWVWAAARSTARHGHWYRWASAVTAARITPVGPGPDASAPSRGIPGDFGLVLKCRFDGISVMQYECGFDQAGNARRSLRWSMLVCPITWKVCRTALGILPQGHELLSDLQSRAGAVASITH